MIARWARESFSLANYFFFFQLNVTRGQRGLLTFFLFLDSIEIFRLKSTELASWLHSYFLSIWPWKFFFDTSRGRKRFFFTSVTKLFNVLKWLCVWRWLSADGNPFFSLLSRRRRRRGKFHEKLISTHFLRSMPCAVGVKLAMKIAKICCEPPRWVWSRKKGKNEVDFGLDDARSTLIRKNFHYNIFPRLFLSLTSLSGASGVCSSSFTSWNFTFCPANWYELLLCSECFRFRVL